MKKILIIAAAAGLLAVGRSAQAGVVESGTAYMTQGTGSQPELQVAYSVSQSGSLYTYSYTFTVGTLVGSVFTPTTANPVTSFTVDTPFSLTIAGISTDSAGAPGILIPNNSITWSYATAPANSDTVSYTSTFPPVLGGGSANDGSPSVSWSVANPGGSPIPDPAPVPEASTVMAGALMLLPLGIGAVRALRKERVA